MFRYCGYRDYVLSIWRRVKIKPCWSRDNR
nr:MAG TPA: hypothetical protein [Caudoviricetes sp.]